MPEPGEPAISVVIPVYNGARFLRDTLASVLAQTLLPCEVITVDDGSTDESADIIRQLAATSAIPIRYCYQANRGPGAARNTGVGLASGRLIAFLDQDDLWLPEKLARQVKAMAEQPDAGCVIVKQRFLLADGFHWPPWVRSELVNQELTGLTPSAILVKRALFSHIGYFNEEMITASDVDWISRLSDAGISVASVDEVLLLHRIHPQNQSRLVGAFHAELLELTRRSVQRKHGSPATP